MKQSLIITFAALAFSAPLAAADTPSKPELPSAYEAQRTSSPATATPVSAAQAGPVRIAPPADVSKKPNWRRINHKINKRAKNAVENGATPVRVRAKVQAYKRKLYRRWKASQ